MATTDSNVIHDLNHFRAFEKHFFRMRRTTRAHVKKFLASGEMQVSTMQENVISHLSGIATDSRHGRDFADGTDAKMATVQYRERKSRAKSAQAILLEGIDRQVARIRHPRKNADVRSWFDSRRKLFRPRVGTRKLIQPTTKWNYTPGNELEVLDRLRYDVKHGTTTISQLVVNEFADWTNRVFECKLQAQDQVTQLHQLIQDVDQQIHRMRNSTRVKPQACAQVKNASSKRGGILLQVYEPKQDRFYFFRIPWRAYRHLGPKSPLKIWFNEDGSPRRDASSYSDLWRYEVSSFEAMATGSEGVKWLNK